MNEIEHFYTLFGAFVYKITTTDGSLDNEKEKQIAQKIVNHPYGEAIKTAFDNENTNSVEDLYEKVIAFCKEKGPNREYEFLIDVLEVTTNNPSSKKIVEKFKADIHSINTQAGNAPPWYHFLLEGRMVFEWLTTLIVFPFLPKRVKGNNHPVLLFPPFLGSDTSTILLRTFLKRQGFATYKWELGTNFIHSAYLTDLKKKLDEVHETHQEKVSLAGWSAGGMFAKILANQYPEKVAQVITIGSPVWGIKNTATNADFFYKLFRGKKRSEQNDVFINLIEATPSVPITCIYSKTDGLINWKYAQEAENLREDIQNIEVFGSHTGMGGNPSILLAVARALYQNLKGEFKKGTPKTFEKIIFPNYWKKNKK